MEFTKLQSALRVLSKKINCFDNGCRCTFDETLKNTTEFLEVEKLMKEINERPETNPTDPESTGEVLGEKS